MRKLEYIAEYDVLKKLSAEVWLDFIVLKYDEGPPSPKEMFEDLREWMKRFANTISINNACSLVFFARVEDSEEMPRHLHLLLGRKHILDRYVHQSNLKLWANEEARAVFLSDTWEHGHAYIKPYDLTNGDGVGYICKKRGSYEECFFSSGLKKLLLAEEPT